MPFIKTLLGQVVNTDNVTHVDLSDSEDEINLTCTIHFVNNSSISLTGDVDSMHEEYDSILEELNKAGVLKSRLW